MKKVGNRAASWVMVAAVTAMLSPVSMSFAAVVNDEVTSVKLKEADGTSGQNTNTGSGVKTGHIQDGAVTVSKLGIVCPTGNYLQYVVGSGWVCSAGTAGPQGIQGIQGPAGAAGPQGETAKYANVIVVAKSGGDFTDPVVALNSITSASEANPYLLKIMPGVYDLGGSVLVTKPFVDVEGSGEKTTVLKSAVNVISASDNVEIRHLTAESIGGSNSSAIYVGGSSKLTHVTAKASGGVYHNIGIDTRAGSPIMTDVTVEVVGDRIAKTWGIIADTQDKSVTLNTARITATNGSVDYAIGAYSGDLLLNNVTTKAYGGAAYGGASDGMWATGGNVIINNSYIYGEAEGIVAQAPVAIQNSTVKGASSVVSLYTTVKIANSQIDGPLGVTFGVVKCFNAYDTYFMPLACQ